MRTRRSDTTRFDWWSHAAVGNRLIVSRPTPIRHPNRKRRPLRRFLPRLSLRWLR